MNFADSHRSTILFFLVLCCVLLSFVPASATDKCGAVCDETWTSTESPYVVTCDVTVAAGCALTIDAIVEIRFQAGTRLQVSGSLDVNGTSGSEVILTSDAAVPAVADWVGVWLRPGSTSTLDYATVSWADNGVYVYGAGASATLDHVTVSNNTEGVLVNSSAVTLTDVTASSNVDGLYVYRGDATQVEVSGGSFTGNQQYGVHVNGYTADAPSVTVSGASIHSNLGSHDFYAERYSNASEHVVLARGNWWGTSDPAAIGSRIRDQRSDINAPMVDWCAYLDGPGGVERDVECPDLAICDETANWTVTSRPYLLTSDLIVCPTGTLNVGPGVEVRTTITSPEPDFTVKGTLGVNGTSGNEVLLTSDAAVPGVGDWYGVRLLEGGTGTLDYATVSWADSGVQVRDSGTSATLDHVTVSHNTQGVYVYYNGAATLTDVTATSNTDGLYVYGYYGQATQVEVTGGSFTGNEQYGVHVDGYLITAPLVAVTGASIHSNLGSHDFYTEWYPDPSEHVVQARGNWWGTSDPAAIGPRIRDHRSEVNSPIVDWCAYLDGPGGVERDVECPDLAICDETANWTVTSRPYLLTSDLIICPTGTLNVGPGVEVRTAITSPEADFTVKGTLGVNGTSGNEVLLTSDAAVPGVGDWYGVRLLEGGTGTLDYATVSWADNGVQVRDSGTSATLDHVTVSHNTQGVYVYYNGAATLTDVTATSNTDGLYVYGYYGQATQVEVTGGSFTGNEQYGVHVNGYLITSPLVTVSGASIHSNLGSHDFYAERYSHASEHVVQARGNWWGTSDPAAIGPRIHDQRSITNAPIVDWCAYLDGPGGVERDVECPDLAICDETANWTVTSRPYLLTSDLIICPTGTLNVGPGVEVRTAITSPEPDFWVNGTLDVNGTSGSEVLLTSDAAAPAKGDWYGVHLRQGSTGTLDHATVSWADNGIHVRDGGTTATLDHVTATDNTVGVFVYNNAAATLTDVTATSNVDGLYVYRGDAIQVEVTGGSFTGNEQYGVHVNGFLEGAPSVTVSGASIHSNLSSHDFYSEWYSNASEHAVQARGNWWGTSDPAAVGPRIYDQRSNVNSPIVDWCAYLDGPGGVERDVECPDLSICDETTNWTVTSRPYLLTSDLVVCPTGTLSVGPGVEVRTAITSPEPEFKVKGTLDVDGTSGNEVLFTSDAAVPAAGDWNGVKLLEGATGTLDYAVVSWADNGIHVRDNGTSVALNHATASDNTVGIFVYGDAAATLTEVTATSNVDGLYSRYGDAAQIDISGGSFTENEQYGLHIDGMLCCAPSVTVSGASIHSNLGGYDLYAESYSDPGQHVVQARGNWWGTSDPAAIGQRVFDHRSTGNSPMVDWCAYLDGPGGVERDVECPDLAICGETASWDETARPYLLTSDMIVCPTGTLVVGPGVEVRTAITSPAPDFEVEGALDVDGTWNSKTLLTSDAAVPALGDWGGVRLRSASTGTLEHATVSWANNGVIVYDDASATLRNVTATDNLNGLYVIAGDDTQVDVSGGSFTGNAQYGVRIHGSGASPSVTLCGASIHSNLGTHDLYTQAYSDAASTLIWAPDNWWGTTSFDLIRQRIYDQDDNSSSPVVWFKPFGPGCELALGGDGDGDNLGDIEDNCPVNLNYTQADTDGDGMGDACDPDPGAQPVGPCDGIDDTSDGYVDADGDGWGDPCDFQPTRDGCYPGAPEICDGFDNDGDASFALDELTDADLDGAIACGDCDDFEPEVYPCACESCINEREDDCDGLMDSADPECFDNPYCVVVTAGPPEPGVHVHRAACGGATLSGPFDVIRGHVSQMEIAGGSVDLGNVVCAAGGLAWDRVTDLSPDPNPSCNDTALFYLARDTGAGDFGAAYPGGEPRDTMNPDPVCP